MRLRNGQLPLIDVAPETAPEIHRLARAWLTAKSKATKAKDQLDMVTEQLHDAVLTANLSPVEGEYRLSVDDLVVMVTPRAAKVSVKEAEYEPETDAT